MPVDDGLWSDAAEAMLNVAIARVEDDIGNEFTLLADNITAIVARLRRVCIDNRGLITASTTDRAAAALLRLVESLGSHGVTGVAEQVIEAGLVDCCAATLAHLWNVEAAASTDDTVSVTPAI